MGQSTLLPWRRCGSLDYSFHCEGRPGVILGSPKNKCIHCARLVAYGLCAPLLTVDVTLHTYLVLSLTLLGMDSMLQSAAQMEPYVKDVEPLWIEQDLFAMHD